MTRKYLTAKIVNKNKQTFLLFFYRLAHTFQSAYNQVQSVLKVGTAHEPQVVMPVVQFTLALSYVYKTLRKHISAILYIDNEEGQRRLYFDFKDLSPSSAHPMEKRWCFNLNSTN